MSQTVTEIKHKMIEIYGDNCWMGYKVSRKNQYTFHHIKEKRNGGKEVIENGALLTREAHDDLNILEFEKRILYKKLNELFTMLNKTQAPPTKEYWSELYGVLEEAKIYINLSPYFIPNDAIEVLPYRNPERQKVDIYVKEEKIEPLNLIWPKQTIDFINFEYARKLRHASRNKDLFKRR